MDSPASDIEILQTLNGVRYLLNDTGAVPPLYVFIEEGIPKPSVLFPVPHDAEITSSTLQAFRDAHLDKDDIFQPAFLRRVVFCGPEVADATLKPSAWSLLAAWQMKSICFLESTGKDGAPSLAPGPYIWYQGKVWEPWRLYQDDNLAMMTTFRPKARDGNNSELQELDNVLATNNIRIAVPSRCYSSAKAVAGKPLLGVCVVVKDCFDIKGFNTSLCNRAWTEYYAPKTETAPSVERLQALGAVIVGKTRLNAMVVRVECMECVEFLAPFNPRGDGYQTPSGSSSGSCVALSAYPWIDLALGWDTNGSSRKPAYWTGCFAIRPTTGVLDTTGIASFCPFYDVPALFGRDISRFRYVASLWYGDSPKLSNLRPSAKVCIQRGAGGLVHGINRGCLPQAVPRILYPTDYLPTTSEAQKKLIDQFVRDLEEHLGVGRTKISLADMWRETRPPSAQEIDLTEYLETAATLPYYKDACGILQGFVDGYTERFGKRPFLHRALRWRWEQADKVTPEERDEGWERIRTYRDWLLSNIFQEGTVVILPIDDGKPNNRENHPPPFSLLNGYHPLYMSPIAGTPEVTAPVGGISYHSEVTGRDEPLPISVSVVSAPGTDLDLIDLVNKTFQAGKRPLEVATGRSIFRP